MSELKADIIRSYMSIGRNPCYKIEIHQWRESVMTIKQDELFHYLFLKGGKFTVECQ